MMMLFWYCFWRRYSICWSLIIWSGIIVESLVMEFVWMLFDGFRRWLILLKFVFCIISLYWKCWFFVVLVICWFLYGIIFEVCLLWLLNDLLFGSFELCCMRVWSLFKKWFMSCIVLYRFRFFIIIVFWLLFWL